MHQSSYHIIEQFRNLMQKHFKDDKVKILDVGSYGVNGTYKDIFSDENKFIYTGLDVQPGPNVDYVAENPYVWSELKDESYDAIISGQAFEHIEFPWLTVQEMSKKLKKNGLICIVAPSRGPEHKYPIDCWRYYPDGFRALAKWTGLEVLETKTFWGSTGFSDGSDQWGDTYCILRKGENGCTIRKPEYRSTAGQRMANKNNPLRSDKTESYYSFARDEVINAIVRNALPAKKILEIGCAGGATGKKLKEIFPVEYYVGIDVSEQAAVIAKQYLDRVIMADIEKTDLWNDHGLKHGDFDLILVLDVLEHLYNPWDVLADLSEYLRIGGYIVASIPNIQNVTIIKDLIKGKWRYENAGILDATHVRFFTLEEIESMFSGAELSIKRTDYILNPSIDVSSIKETGNNFKLENLSIKNLSKEDILRMFIYQYVIIAKKESAISHDWETRLEKIEELVPAVTIQEKRDDKIVGSEIIYPTLFEKKDIISGLVSIVILTFNQLTYTKECVESIRKQTTEQYEIIFIDNGSTDGTVKWLRRLIKENPNYKLIENHKNLGFSKGCNQGIHASSGEYILFLNNDVIVTEGWLSGMLECLNSSPDIGIVGPMTNNISGIQKIQDSDYSSPENLDDYSRRFRELNRYRRVPARRIVGFCMLFKRELVEKIGLLDKSFGSGNFEDDDYCLRAALEGYRNVIAADVFIHHYGNRSFIGNGIDYSSAMAQNKKIFHKKWNGIDAKSLLGKKLLSLKAMETADHLSQKGLIEKAVEKFLEGIKNSPNDKKVYFTFSEMLIAEKQFKDALDVLSEMPADDEDLRRLILIGYCKEGLELYEEADGYANRVLMSNPEYALALNLKGILEYRKGNKSAAEDFFQKAIESDRGFGEPYTNLGVLKWSNGQSEEALILIEKGFILGPTIMDIAIIYHSAVIQLKQFERAEKIFRTAKDLYPLNRRITFLLIDILIQQGKNESALKEIQEAMISYGIDDDIIAAALEIRNRIGDKTTNSKLDKKGTISLCMIVKNEEKNLSRCLLSVKPIIDEMIVVDTGSTDRTKDIAKIFGAKVYDFEWIDDFSKARNFSFSKASGDWLLILDADEIISSQDLYVISEIISRGKKRAYSFITRNYVHNMMSVGWTPNDGKYNHEEAGSGWFSSKKVRLFPNDSRIQFENQVHELVESTLKRAGIKVRDCNVPIHHYGKLTTKKIISKGEDYYFLGKIKLDKRGDDMQALFELAVQAMELKKYDEAIELWQKFLNLQTDIPKAFLTVAYVNVGSAYLRLGKYTDALLFSEKAIELNPDLKEAVVNYAFSAFYVGDMNKVISVLENLLSNVPEYLPAEVLLSLAYCIAGNKEKGIEYLKDIKKKGINCARYLYEYAKTLFSLKKVEQAMLLIDAAVESDCLNKDILTLLSECYKQKTN